MQVQFLFLFPSLAIQWEKTAERVEAPVSWEEPDGTGMAGRTRHAVVSQAGARIPEGITAAGEVAMHSASAWLVVPCEHRNSTVTSTGGSGAQT